MKVYLREFEKHNIYMKKINNTNLEDLEIRDESENIIKISQECINTFNFIGLSNVDFIKMRFWDDGYEKYTS